MHLKLPDAQLFLGRTGCHSLLSKSRAINSQDFGPATSSTLRKKYSIRLPQLQTKYTDHHLQHMYNNNEKHDPFNFSEGLITKKNK